MTETILMDDMADVYKEAAEAMKPLIDVAFNRGYAAGVMAAQENLLKAVAAMNTDHIKAIKRDAEPTIGIMEHALFIPSSIEDRATPGTVKPMIIDILRQNPHGITTKRITELTGIKPNSVRGTLWNLQQDGSVTKNEGGMYRLVEKQEAQE